MIAVWIAFTYLSLWALVGVGSMETICCSFRFSVFLFFSFCALRVFPLNLCFFFFFFSFFSDVMICVDKKLSFWYDSPLLYFFFFFNCKSAFNLNTKWSIAATAHDDWRGLWEIDKIWKQYKIAWYNNMYI